MRLSRPVYEALPYAYMLAGAGVIALSFRWRAPGWSDWLAAFGLAVVLIGVVLILRRRDYRIQRRRYGGAFEGDEDD